MGRSRHQGFSLIELLLALGVIALLVVAAFAVYPQVRAANQAKDLADLTLAIRAQVASLYAPRGGSYAGLNTLAANRARVFSSGANGGNFDTSVIHGPHGGRVIVNAYNLATVPVVTPGHRFPANGSFYIRYYDVPEPVCVKLLPMLVGKVEGMRVDMTYVLTDQGLDIDAMVAACAADPPVDLFFWAR